MLTDIVLGSKAVWRILGVLADAPGQGITKEEIRKITKLGGNSLFKSVNLILHNNLILSDKHGKRRYYKLNLNNKYVKHIIEIINLEKQDTNNLNPKILIILKEYIRQIFGLINLGGAYVFGSVVKSSYSEKSDIDVAVITKKEISARERIDIEKISENVEKRFGREIQTHFFSENEFAKSKTSLVEQIHRDGIKLI